MNLQDIKRVALGLAFLSTSFLAAHSATPAAHAAVNRAAITAIADNAAYGIMEVAGHDFKANDSVQIQVLDSPGTWRMVASTSAGRDGTFIKIFRFAVSCAAQAARAVTLQAVDTSTNETTLSIGQALGTPVSLAQAQLDAATTKQAVTDAQAAMAVAQAAMLQNAAACQAAAH